MTKFSKSRPARLQQLSLLREGMAGSFDKTGIFFRSVGRGETAIVCCNGLGCSTFYFDYLEAYFKRCFQVITWDYRGHGRSESPRLKKNCTIDALVADLKAVLDELGVKKAVFIGHSMGTQVLYEFYARYPHRALALIPCLGTFGKPIDTFYDSPASKYIFEVLYIFNHLFPKASNMISTILLKNPLAFTMGGFFRMMKTNMIDKEIMKRYIDHILNIDPVFLSKMLRSIQEHSAEATLKKIKVPTLIIGGDEDTFTPIWVSKKMNRLIPHSELFVIKKGTHVALVEQPDLINLRIEKFLYERVCVKTQPMAQNQNQYISSLSS